MTNPAKCPLCQAAIQVPADVTEVQAYAKHFNGECRGRAKRLV